MELSFIPLLHDITPKELDEMQTLHGMHRHSYQKLSLIHI